MSDLTPPDASSSYRFNAWYVQHCRELAARWYQRHPREYACSIADMDSADRARAELEDFRLYGW